MMKITENRLMYKIKKVLSTTISFLIILSIFGTFTINANEANALMSTDLNKYGELPIELLIDLESVKNQLISQNALEQYPIFEKIIIDSYFSLDKKTYDNFYEIRSTSTNHKIKNYKVGQVSVKETYLTAYEVDQLYEALSAPNATRDIISNIMGGFFAPFSLLTFIQERTIREPLYELRQNKLPGFIIETVDAGDFNRYTAVVSRWYKYPKW